MTENIYRLLYDIASKRIADLEQENAKLKADYEVLSCSVGDFGELQEKLEGEQRKNNGLSDNLTKAIELLTRFAMASVYFNGKEADLVQETEQFLKEVTK